MSGVAGDTPDLRIGSTRRRRAVLTGLARHGPLTAKELSAQLHRDGEFVGLKTIYRVLTALADAGRLDTFEHDGRRTYRLCPEGGHQHLLCEGCKRVTEIADDRLERWVRHTATEHGFRITRQRLEIYGHCRACQTIRPS